MSHIWMGFLKRPVPGPEQKNFENSIKSSLCFHFQKRELDFFCISLQKFSTAAKVVQTWKAAAAE